MRFDVRRGVAIATLSLAWYEIRLSFSARYTSTVDLCGKPVYDDYFTRHASQRHREGNVCVSLLSTVRATKSK